MSYCAGKYLDHKSAMEGLPKMLSKAYGAEPFPGFIPGEIAHMAPPNARAQMMLDTPIGKGSGIFFGFLWQMRKLGFHVAKVQEWIEISPVHSQYYQLTVQQKQTLEGQVKNALHGVHTSITDFELLAHDLRRYREYMNYFEGIEKAKAEKDSDLERRNNQTLKSIFIDQVDVHTGEGVALKLIASRWPTIIVDFMKIKDSDLDPPKIARDYGFSEAEGVVLATKNKIFQQWRSLFLEAVKSRYHNLREMAGARKRSIDEYKNMVRPYILRHRMIREFGETPESKKVIQSFSWWRPSSQAVSIDAAEYWLWKPFMIPEIHRASAVRYDQELPIEKMGWSEPIMSEIKENYGRLKEAKLHEVKTFPSGIEPVDNWVLFLRDEMVKYYKEKYGYRSSLDIVDVFEARKSLINQFAEYSRWDWQPSPYFVCLELPTLRVVVRNPDGTESETFIFGSYPDMPMMAPLDTQNIMLVRLMELMLQNRETDNYITDMVGDTVDGKKIHDVVKDDYPYLMGEGKKSGKTVEGQGGGKKGPQVKQVTNMQKYFRFSRPGPYDALFMERVAAIMVKEISQSTFAFMKGYIKSAVGAP